MTDAPMLPLVFSDDSLALTADIVAAMPKAQRERRVDLLIADAMRIMKAATEQFATADGKRIVATAILFSGGGDSTVLAHLFRNMATHAVHANTGIGIEETREFVRATCATWELPLIERHVPRDCDTYAAIVRERGFPGPGQHYKMFQRLKERAIRAVTQELLGGATNARVLYLSGRRRSESERRAMLKEIDREGSRINCAPLVNWTKPDLATYGRTREVPRNPVSDLIHMSGECLCCSFATLNEREEIRQWFRVPIEQIEQIEREIATREDIPWWRRRWGWGASPELRALDRDYCAAHPDEDEPSLFTEEDSPGNLCGGACEARAAIATEISA
jgi:3'-phosphoadenosine 5'-phosphosulfate sulfotransferase (PAPS reductase)/FAD synthetase